MIRFYVNKVRAGWCERCATALRGAHKICWAHTHRKATHITYYYTRSRHRRRGLRVGWLASPDRAHLVLPASNRTQTRPKKPLIGWIIYVIGICHQIIARKQKTRRQDRWHGVRLTGKRHGRRRQPRGGRCTWRGRGRCSIESATRTAVLCGNTGRRISEGRARRV